MNNGFTTTVKSFFFFQTAINTFLWEVFHNDRTVCHCLYAESERRTQLCVIKTTRAPSVHANSHSHTQAHVLCRAEALNTHALAHTRTHTEDIKAQGIANVEDALKHLSRHINDPFHPCIRSLLLTVKTASRKTKRCFLFLINMRGKKKRENSHPRTSTVNKTYKSTVPTEVRHLVC